MVSDSEREQVREEAKRILQDFSRSLEKVNLGKREAKEEGDGFRKESEGNDEDKDFRERIFLNAPEKQGDFILAEKKTW